MTRPGTGRWRSWPGEMAGAGKGCQGSSALSVTAAASSPGSGAIAACLFLLYLSGKAPCWLSSSPRRAIAMCPPPGFLGCVTPETGCMGTRRGRARTRQCFGHGAAPPLCTGNCRGGKHFGDILSGRICEKSALHPGAGGG